MNLNLSDTSDDDTEIYESKLKKKHSRLSNKSVKNIFYRPPPQYFCSVI